MEDTKSQEIYHQLKYFRKQDGLPTDDLEFLYTVLKVCPLGVPITTICTLLGLHTTDFAGAWAKLHKLQEVYNVTLAKWGQRGRPSIIAIRDLPIGQHYLRVSQFMQHIQRLGLLHPPQHMTPPKRKWKKKYEKVFKELPTEFTRADVARITGFTLVPVRRIVERWLTLGWIETVNEGSRGAGHAYVYRKLTK